MLDRDITLSADENVRVLALQIGEEIQRKDHGPIAAVLEWHDPSIRLAVLDCNKHIFDCDFRYEVVVLGFEYIKRSLG